MNEGPAKSGASFFIHGAPVCERSELQAHQKTEKDP